MTPEKIANLAELELSEEEEIVSMFKDWDEDTRRRFYKDIENLQEKYHRARLGRVRMIYSMFGQKLRIRRLISIPKKYKEES